MLAAVLTMIGCESGSETGFTFIEQPKGFGIRFLIAKRSLTIGKALTSHVEI